MILWTRPLGWRAVVSYLPLMMYSCMESTVGNVFYPYHHRLPMDVFISLVYRFHRYCGHNPIFSHRVCTVCTIHLGRDSGTVTLLCIPCGGSLRGFGLVHFAALLSRPLVAWRRGKVTSPGTLCVRFPKLSFVRRDRYHCLLSGEL